MAYIGVASGCQEVPEPSHVMAFMFRSRLRSAVLMLFRPRWL
jgi:hypothetical protein